jgi:hypothetical protein
LENLKIKKTHK